MLRRTSYAALPKTFFRELLLGFPALLFLAKCRMWENSKARRQTLLLSLFFLPFNVHVNVVPVESLLLKLVALLPEATLIERFAVSQI